MDKVSLQPKLQELSPSYDVSTTKSDTCPDPTKAQIQEINPVNLNVRLLFTSFFIKKNFVFQHHYLNTQSISLCLSLSFSTNPFSISPLFQILSLFLPLFSSLNQCCLCWSPQSVPCLQRSHPSTTLHRSTHHPLNLFPLCWRCSLYTSLIPPFPPPSPFKVVALQSLLQGFVQISQRKI